LNEPDLDTPIAELERYGLSLRMIEALDNAGMYRIRHLIGVTERYLLSLPQVRHISVAEVRIAIENFLAGEPTKSKWDCMGVSEAEFRRRKREVWESGFVNGLGRRVPPKENDRQPPPVEFPTIPESAFGIRPLPDKDLL